VSSSSSRTRPPSTPATQAARSLRAWTSSASAGRRRSPTARETSSSSSSIPASARALVETHRRAGDLLAIVTATNDFVTRPIAQRFGIDALIATELEHDAGGRATGEIRGVPSFRDGKIARVDQWLAAQGRTLADFESSTFYSDSTNDLPLLERASEPVADDTLRAIATERGWRVLDLFKEAS